MLELWSHHSSPAAAHFFSGNWFRRHFPRERVSKKHFCLISLSKHRELLFFLIDIEVILLAIKCAKTISEIILFPINQFSVFSAQYWKRRNFSRRRGTGWK